MNREIKFRAWDKKRKCMIGTDYPNNWGNSCDEWWGDTNQMTLEAIEDLNKDENIELMQFTGMNDLNGKPIYEGDIVEGYLKSDDEICLDAYNFKGVVVYQDASFSIIDDIPLNSISKGDEITIIGNIYENSELLK